MRCLYRDDYRAPDLSFDPGADSQRYGHISANTGYAMIARVVIEPGMRSKP